jgi:hypothetical protein
MSDKDEILAAVAAGKAALTAGRRPVRPRGPAPSRACFPSPFAQDLPSDFPEANRLLWYFMAAVAETEARHIRADAGAARRAAPCR